MKIFLIGFPGSGKSHLGRELSTLMKIPFADTDGVIEEKYKRSITTIFQEEGEERFRQMEDLALSELLKKKKIIVATGGGLPCWNDNMRKMNESGITVYLKASEAFLYHRLFREKKQRPLIASMNDATLMEYIFSTLKDRKEFYEKAQLIVDAEKITAPQTRESNWPISYGNYIPLGIN